MTTNRRLAAILAADVAGYSRLMAADEVGTLAALKAVRREVVDPAIAEHNGRIVKTTGDGMLVEFASAVDAVTCAMAVQEKMAARGGEITFRIGINVGDIIIDGDDIFGDGVNVAARVENECQPGRVYLSAQAFDQVRAKTPFSFEDLGEKPLKNIDRPMRVYAAGTAVAPGNVTPTEQGAPLPLPDKPSIAVLPFQNMSGDPEQDYFADGMVEEIITALGRFKSLFVIARNSSFSYKGKSPDVRQVGRELGVRYVLEGSVRKGGGRIRITGQLIEAATGAHLWADRFDGSNEDIFDLQDRVTSQVVGAIAPALQQAETARSSLKRPESLAAYDLYLRALSELNKFSPAALREAARLCNQAIEIEPTYAVVHSLAAFCYSYLYISKALEDHEKECAEGLRLAERALALANDDAEVLTRVAHTFANLGGQLDRNRELVDRALSINPNYAVAWLHSGYSWLYTGSPELALKHCATALRLSPTDGRRPVMLVGLATANLFLENFLEALDWARKAYFEATAFPAYGYVTVAACAAHAGDLQLAKDAVARLRNIDGTATLDTMRDYYERELRWRRTENVNRLIDGLRIAGLPE